MKCLAIYAGIAALLAPAAFAQPLPCSNGDEAKPSKARKEFVAPYHASADALRAGRTQEAIAQADLAAPYAMDGLQLQAVLSVRSAALLAARDDVQLVPTLEMRLKVGCFLRAGDAEEVASQLEAARARANTPSPR